MYVYSEVPSHVGGNGGNVILVATFSHIASMSALSANHHTCTK